MNSYDEVKLKIVRELNSAVLNGAFTKLYDNDTELVPKYDYTPNIWENKWYNDDVIPGYSKGYCVWKNTYLDLSSFLDDYGDVVFQYAQENDMLKNVLDMPWSEVTALTSIPTQNIWIQAYMNVVSGYAKQTTTSLTMNDKVRYIKISFSNNKINGIKISNLRFYNSSSGEVFNYPENVYFSFDGLSVENPKALLNDSGSATVIECTESGGSIIIDFGRNSLLLNTYNKMSLHVDASNVRDVASSMTIYASVDGEDYAQIVASSQFAVSRSDSKTISSKIVIRNLSKSIQYMQPLFEYGPLVSAYTGTDKPTIELYVSTMDDNKELLSNRTAWNSIVLSSQDAYERFVKTEVEMLFADHIKRYHFDGILSNEAEVNEILLSRDLSNFQIDSVPSQLKVIEHDKFINADGFDYVAKFQMRYFEMADNSDAMKHYLFQWYRLWNSGYLEHGGVVKCQEAVGSLNASDYYISVDLSWDGNAPVYNYTETSGVADGNVYVRNYYGSRNGNKNDQVFENISQTDMLLHDARYTIAITPVQFDYNLDIQGGKYRDVSILNARSYPDAPLNNKVSSYITTEVHHIKNSSFCFTKSNTDDLKDISKMQLYTYHTTGFIKRGES